MSKLIKYFLILVGGLGVLIIAAVLILPQFIDVQKYKPMIEEKVAAATGRSVMLGGDLKLSLFPWVGVSFSDFHLGNPEGFESKDFIRVKSFEAHVKVMPLLSKEVLVDSFVLDGPEIYLERRKNGAASWEGLGGSQPTEQKKEAPAPADRGDFALKSIEVGEFSIVNGMVSFVDRQQGKDKVVISDINLQLKDVSLERPIGMEFSAVADGKPVSLSGIVGPVGVNPGQGTVPFDIAVTAADQVKARLAGKLENPVGDLQYSFKVDVSQFSPRKLMHTLGQPFPLEAGDPAAFDALSLGMNLAGTPANVSISGGRLVLDSSTLDFKGDAKSFAPLNLVFEGNLDSIDLDRYLPPQKEQATSKPTQSKQSKSAEKRAEPVDYAPLRNLTLDTRFTVGQMKVKGGKVQNISMHLTGNKGIFKLNPLSMDLYQGKVSSSATVNVQGKSPVTELALNTNAVQVGPLLKDFAKKDVLEGALFSDVGLNMRGDTPAEIKRSLNGKGELVFQDGAIVGIDLAGMVRNVKSSFGLAEKPVEKPRTDFAELKAPFTITNGVFNTPGTVLVSPLIRVSLAGKANLVTEDLNMKVKPKFVATLKGQGDTQQRSGLMVPVLVTGTFTSPKFAPDLSALVESQLPDKETLKKVIEDQLSPDRAGSQEKAESIEEGIKQLIPKFPFN